MKHSMIVIGIMAAMTSQVRAQEPVTIDFAAEVAGKPFLCGQTYPGVGSLNTTVSGADYRMFISDPALVRADGSLAPITLDQDDKWQYRNVALLDFEDGSGTCAGTGNQPTNTTLRGTAATGEFIGLTFTIGLPFELNHIDPTLAKAPLNTTGMFWNWQGGFRFLRIDLMPAVGGAAAKPDHTDVSHDDSAGAQTSGGMHMPPEQEGRSSGWFLHVGSTVCAGKSQTEAPSACQNPNLMTIVLPAFDPGKNTVVIDPAPVLAEADLTRNTPDTAPGCMSFPSDVDCRTVMSRLGLPFGEIAPDAQLLVTAR